MQGLYEERHPHTHSSVQSDRDMGEEGGKERTRRMDVWMEGNYSLPVVV